MCVCVCVCVCLCVCGGSRYLNVYARICIGSRTGFGLMILCVSQCLCVSVYIYIIYAYVMGAYLSVCRLPSTTSSKSFGEPTTLLNTLAGR